MPAGRPREFDPDAALDRAVAVFWRQGYEGTTIPDLTAALGINRPSLYAAFGNKQSLFRKALARYSAGPAGFIPRALREPTARAVIETLLRSSVEMLSDPKHPRGCLVVQAALACGAESESVRKELEGLRASGVAAIRKRFERARREGDWPGDASPADMARYLATVLYGMAVQAAGGASRKELQAVAALARKVWPIKK
ncbi:MAG TPA: TetR/AcrR family transcriptional regulator [Fimbriiglobus sp.]|jgi:AcrR family transcriptional regulator